MFLIVFMQNSRSVIGCCVVKGEGDTERWPQSTLIITDTLFLQWQSDESAFCLICVCSVMSAVFLCSTAWGGRRSNRGAWWSPSAWSSASSCTQEQVLSVCVCVWLITYHTHIKTLCLITHCVVVDWLFFWFWSSEFLSFWFSSQASVASWPLAPMSIRMCWCHILPMTSL